MPSALSLSPLANSMETLASALTSTLIMELLATPVDGPIVIQAGHYHLGMHAGNVSDTFDLCLHTEKQVWQEMSAMAVATWKAACAATQSLRRIRDIKLMTLVNDWQYVQSPATKRRDVERECAGLRAAYYRSTPHLPAQLAKILGDYYLGSEDVFKQHNDSWLFSEQRLRHGFSRTLRGIMRDPKHTESLGLRSALTPKNEPIVYGSTPDEPEQCLSYCGNSNCCGEFLQLLQELQQRKVRTFINLYPAECRPPVTAGAKLGQQLFGLDDLSIINIAITPINGNVRTFTDRA